MNNLNHLTLICGECGIEYKHDDDNQRCPKCNTRHQIFIEREAREECEREITV